MADVKWIKLSTDLFNNRKIKQIRKLPEGDAIIGVWMQILCLAGDVNLGGLMYFSKDIPYTDEMFANEFERPVNIVRLSLNTFQRFGMIEVIDDVICVSNWEKYQSQDKLEALKEYNRDKKREYRERHKEKMLSLTCPGQVLGSPQTDNISISTSISLDSLNIKEKKLKFGHYENVKMLESEFQKLIEEYGHSKTIDAIEYLSLYRADKGYKNKSDYLSIRRWVISAVEERANKNVNPFKEKLRKEMENEQERSDGINDGYQGGLSQLLQGPSGN